jgi:hypothetical protein
LAQAGYSQENWQQLEIDLRSQILPLPAVLSDTSNQFGDVYEIRGVLTGTTGVFLKVFTIWMVEYETAETKFITLYPDKEGDAIRAIYKSCPSSRFPQSKPAAGRHGDDR